MPSFLFRRALPLLALLLGVGSPFGVALAQDVQHEQEADVPAQADMVPQSAAALFSPAKSKLTPTPERDRGDVIEVDAEYRARVIRIDPMDLSGNQVEQMDWVEHRLRLDGKFLKAGIGSITLQADMLDGVLWGDNGRFGQDPSSNAGVSLASQQPNLTRWRLGLPNDEADAVDSDAYVPVLEAAPLLELNHAYADIVLPLGLLRVGRQPLAYGAGISAHDGARWNRWGVSQFSDSADRILFGTKLDQAFYVATDPDHKLDPSLEDGVVLGLFYDFQKLDLPQRTDDDLRRMGLALDFKWKEADWGGFQWSDVTLGGRAVRLDNDQFDTGIFAFPVILGARVNALHLSLQYTYLRGETREIAEGFEALGSGLESDEPQALRAHGAQAVATLDLGRFGFTMEFDFATGDGDPRSTNTLTTFSFARDMNVGLLMFEHILAFESARSVAVGIENLRDADVASFPITEVSTEGRFTNAVALFPQAYAELFQSAKHKVWTRVGVLMAWPEAGGVVDPILTTLAFDGQQIRDDAVNFHGGAPGSYYGTELDLQLGWNIARHFDWVIEGAYLWPGDALEDENGDAVNTYLLENRFVFMF